MQPYYFRVSVFEVVMRLSCNFVNMYTKVSRVDDMKGWTLAIRDGGDHCTHGE